MFLKSITLTGFKSFAARTTLELDRGVTVIVGPNGSGKSNLVDAVAWATGGLSTRGLRADRSEELLFCGAAGRPAASRAEVTLVFDNSSGLLPIDRPEVAITRRYYRSGESQFEINRTPCRLLDITELLAEAGLRRSRYVLLGQGQVEQVLNASPTEHRHVLEEAAGVGKHLWRRDRALRRLDSTRQDLERIAELVAEKERRRRPLVRQARAWERRSGLLEEIRSLRLYLESQKLQEIEERLRSAVDRRTRWEAARTGALDDRSESLKALSAIESAQEDLRSEAVGQLVGEWELAEERMKRLAEVATLRTEARAHQRRSRDRQKVLTEERITLEKNLAEMDGLWAAAQAGVAQARRETARLTDRERALSRAGDSADHVEIHVLVGEKTALAEVAERDSQEKKAIESRLGECAAARDQLRSQQAAIQTKLSDQNTAVAQQAAAVEQAQAEAVDHRRVLGDAEVRAAAARTALAEAQGRLESARRQLSSLDSRHRKQIESLTGWAGWVAELLEVPPELSQAVAAGLERWATAAVFEGPVALGNAMDRVGQTRSDQGPLSVVSALFPGDSDLPARTVARSGSQVVPLVDLLSDGQPSALACRLLGDVVLVDDWRRGWEVVGNHRGLRAVTPQGDLITTAGIRTGGADRLPDLAAIKADTEVASRTFGALDEELSGLRRSSQQLTERREELFAKLQTCRREMLETQRKGERIASRLREAVGEQERLRKRLDALTKAESARQCRLTELENEIALLKQRESSPDQLAIEKRLQETAAAREAAESRHRSQSAALTGLTERRRLATARYERVVGELAEVSLLPGDMWGGPVEQVADIASQAVAIMAARRGFLAAMDQAARQRSRTLATEAVEARKAMSRADQREQEATGKLETLIAEISRMDAERQASITALTEMDSDPAQATAAPLPDTADPEAALASLTAQLARLGPVNPYASSDLKALEEELAGLSDQHDDISASDRRLREVITRLEKEATERYLATFRETARAFEQTFGQVFPGGRGRLRIVDPTDPLGSGVEISARPQGKRVSRLSLLSGGERALGALAFLFALMKTRPAPFYLLDEMDATLDAANLHRVLEVVRELRTHAQILIITHQPQTAEFAETLYGVTLPPGGATQVVSRRLGREGIRFGMPGSQARSA